MKTPKIALCLLLACFSAGTALSQEGSFLHAWGGVQITRFANTDDYYTYVNTNAADKLDAQQTNRGMGGIDYILNFAEMYGFQTGIYYSGMGQRYSGFNRIDNNGLRYAGDTILRNHVHWTSNIRLDYLKVPAMFRFNSPLDENERVNMSIYAGFQVGYLMSVSTLTTTPEAPPFYTEKPDYKKMFKTIDYGWVAGGQINIQLAKKFGLTAGMRYDRAFRGAENRDFFGKMSGTEYNNYIKSHPMEQIFPLTTKKSNAPGRDDFYTRGPSLNSSVGFYLGFYIPLTVVEKRKREIREE